jgi:hypothetical protein
MADLATMPQRIDQVQYKLLLQELTGNQLRADLSIRLRLKLMERFGYGVPTVMADLATILRLLDQVQYKLLLRELTGNQLQAAAVILRPSRLTVHFGYGDATTLVN